MAVSKSLPALPDRLSKNPFSPYYSKEIFEYKIGVILNGTLRDDFEEYCISDGWIKVASPDSDKQLKGMPLLMTLEGVVEVFFDKYPS